MERLRFDSSLVNMKTQVKKEAPACTDLEESEFANDKATLYGLGDEPGPVSDICDYTANPIFAEQFGSFGKDPYQNQNNAPNATLKMGLTVKPNQDYLKLIS